jgi:hypothetical protein
MGLLAQMSQRRWFPECSRDFLTIAFPFFPCAVSRFVRGPFGSRDENGKARPAAGSGGNLDAMPQNPERLSDDEETDAETVALCGIKSSERFEDPPNLFGGNSNASVVHVDPNFRAGAPATNKDATSRLGVFDRITHQIAQGGAQKQAISEHGNVAGNRVDGYSLAQRGMFVLAASLP